MSGPTRRIALAGLGAVGMSVAAALDKGIPGCELTAVAARDREAAAARLAHLRRPPPVVTIAELEPLADVVVECAPSSLFRSICEPFVDAGKTVIALSAGAILDHEDLIERARASGGQILVPSGALMGLDAMAAASEGTIHSVRMVTHKPIDGLAGAPFLATNGVAIENVREPQKIFSGSPREAIKGFPANLNVAVALSLAGIGPDRTELEIWADPTIDRNSHRVHVESDSARFSFSIENIPTENPKTGRITALSVIACLRKLGAPLRVGT